MDAKENTRSSNAPHDAMKAGKLADRKNPPDEFARQMAEAERAMRDDQVALRRLAHTDTSGDNK